MAVIKQLVIDMVLVDFTIGNCIDMVVNKNNFNSHYSYMATN
jgi:hypothetical protein